MNPRIFLGSSTQQAKLLDALSRGLEDVADVDAWMTVFNPGVSTLDRLVELTREVDFAALDGAVAGLHDSARAIIRIAQRQPSPKGGEHRAGER